MEAGASLLRQSARAVMVRGEFQVAPLDFAVVLAQIFDPQIGNRNLTRHNLEVIPFGDFLLHFFRGVTPIVGKTGEAGVEFPLDFVVELDAKHPAAPTFDLISYLVIEPVEFRVVNGFFGLLEPMIASLVRAKNLPARQKLLPSFVRVTTWIGLCSVSVMLVAFTRP